MLCEIREISSHDRIRFIYEATQAKARAWESRTTKIREISDFDVSFEASFTVNGVRLIFEAKWFLCRLRTV